jgi:UDP-glucose 4-epimerase
VNLQEFIKALKINECFSSNIEGSSSVFNFALKNKIKLIYSATSASLGNKGKI